LRDGRTRLHALGEHTKAPLVEQTPSLSIATLRRAPVFAEPDAALTGEVTVGDDGYGWLDIGPQTDGRRELQIRIRFRGSPEAIDERLALARWMTPIGGERWFFVCPRACGQEGTGRRVSRIFIDTEHRTLACRECLGLQYASAQRHDARRDHARRDRPASGRAASTCGRLGPGRCRGGS